MKDFQRISREVTVDFIEEKSTFKGNIDAARVRTATCKQNADESDSLKKSAEPGNLKKKEWIAWS